MATAQIPAIGRTVHYVTRASGAPDQQDGGGAATLLPVQVRAAIITAIDDDGPTPKASKSRTARKAAEDDSSARRVSLTVLGRNGFTFRQHVDYNESGAVPGTWHWPILPDGDVA